MSDLTRREFLNLSEKVLVTAGLATVAVPALAFFYPADLAETPAEAVSAGPAAELAVGESKMVPYGRDPAIVVNTAEGLKAYIAVCTHFACLVKWDAERGELVCPCHDAAFAVEDGSVTGGPPPRGLTPVPVAVVDGEIMVGGTAA